MFTKSPTDKENLTENIWYFSSARTAFKYLLDQLDFGKEEQILLPAYIGITDREGSGVMDPIWDREINYEFFNIDCKLNADLADIYIRVRRETTKALLLIHYFGIPQKELHKIRDYCTANQVYLIEDCAHSLFSKFGDTDLGSIGDFSFFSIHKSIPSESGGFLRSNLAGFELTNPISPSDQISLNALEIYTRMRRLDVSAKRLANYKYLAKLLSDCPYVTLILPELADGVVPLNMPVLVSEGYREPLYFYLMEQGFPTIALYYRLIDELKTDCFEVSHRVSKNILNLPVHQDIESSDLDKLDKAIRAFFHRKLKQ